MVWSEILDMLTCKDLWGYIGGHTLRYTYHSRSHKKAMRRCYYSYVSALSEASKMWVDATVLLSDHNPLLISLKEVDWNLCVPFGLPRIPLRVNHSWMQTLMFKSKVQFLVQHVLSLSVSACMKWEFLVAKLQDVIRDCGKFYSEILTFAKYEAEQLISLMSKKVDSGQVLFDEEYTHLCKAHKCLEVIENQAIQSSKVRARCTEVNDLHANSKCFFDHLPVKRLKEAISHLEVDGSIINDGSSIATVYSEHFRRLFAASYKSDDAWFQALHEALSYTPCLLDSRKADACEKSISEDEVYMALNSLKNGKAPGLDGITKEFVVAFWPLLKSLVLDVCNEVWRDQSMPYTFKLAQGSASQLEINGRLSAPFLIERSVRQGCPLSLLFYALASTPMFYLLEAKMNSQCIHASALRINMKKSAIVNISAPQFQSLNWEGPRIEKGSIFRHLGYPLGVDVPIKDKLAWVLCRVKLKMNKWIAPQWTLHARIKINKKHNRALVLSAWKYVFLNLHLHLMARRTAFIMRITSSHKPLWTSIFWKFIENAKVNFRGAWKLDAWNKFFSHAPVRTSSYTINVLLHQFKSTLSTLKWNGRQRYIGNSLASVWPYWSFLTNPPIACSLGAAARYFNNKGIDSIAKCYNSKWEILPFSVVRRTYAVGATYRSKWLQIISLLHRYQLPLSIDATDPWRDWLFAKHTRWLTCKSNIIALQCNQRWKLQKPASRWHLRFTSIWDSSFTYRMKIFM
ncbi:hypothetical protein KP509_29G024700 [Ceratopteris richardii]|uniref:Reverse transcriptase n=1 Tax=Ceratopteris richardii TaxID=49495 RepID=A0A8T2R6P7_CERRI|nr:hypothetical protein KP509_29G024700 [Ceratopteris richardii]